MGILQRLFGMRSVAKSATGTSKHRSADPIGLRRERIARIRQSWLDLDTDGLWQRCCEATEIATALFGFERLLVARFETPKPKDGEALWTELAEGGAPVFADGDCRFDAELFHGLRDAYGSETLLRAGERIRNSALLDHLFCATDEFSLLTEQYQALATPTLVKDKLMGRIANGAYDPEYRFVLADLMRMIAAQDEQSAIAWDIVRLSQYVPDIAPFDAREMLGALTDGGRAYCVASWVDMNTNEELWRALIRRSAELGQDPTSQDPFEDVLRKLSFLDQSLQGNLVLTQSPGYRGPTQPVHPADRDWWQSLSVKHLGDLQQVRISAKGLVEQLSESWETCRRSITWVNVATRTDFERLLLSGRQVPEVYATEVARQHADTAIAELDKEIESLLFETRVRREVVSDTVTVLLERAAARRQASLNVPQGDPIDPRPLSNGRVQ